MNPYLTRHEDWIDRHWGALLVSLVLSPWIALIGGCFAIRFLLP